MQTATLPARVVQELGTRPAFSGEAEVPLELWEHGPMATMLFLVGPQALPRLPVVEYHLPT